MDSTSFAEPAKSSFQSVSAKLSLIVVNRSSQLNNQNLITAINVKIEEACAFLQARVPVLSPE